MRGYEAAELMMLEIWWASKELGVYTCIMIAVHWILEMSDLRARTMMSAVIKITPDLTSAIVPGSASLYATKICSSS